MSNSAHILADMLEQLSDRGPDSAGVAFYRDPAPSGWCKVSLHSPAASPEWDALSAELSAAFGDASAPRVRATHAVFASPPRRRRRRLGCSTAIPS